MVFQNVLAIAAILLCVSGAIKVANPSSTAGALKSAGLPSHPVLARLLGASEVGVGLSTFFIGGPVPAFLTAGLFAGFAVFVAYAIGRGISIQSCGCFGATDTPPSLAHILVNGALAAGAVAAAPTATPLIEHFSSSWTGAGELGFSAVAAYLAYLMLTDLPSMLSLVEDA